MGRPSNPKLMARVLEAVTNLSEGKGSLTRDILKFVKQNSDGSPRNLTMQVRRALKHAVNAGLLGCKSGRYKMQLELNRVSNRHRQENPNDSRSGEVMHDIGNEPPAGGIDMSRKVRDRRRKRRSGQRARRRSRARGKRKKGSRRRAVTVAKRSRKMSERPRRRGNKVDDRKEDWHARKRRMMAKPKYDDEEEEDDNEDEAEEKEDEDIREPRKMPKTRSVNEDRYSDISGDSVAVGRHRSRRSKHLAEERSPSRRGNGDGESHRKSARRSRSRRRRGQPRERENRQVPASEEPAEDRIDGMDEERDHEVMEMDEDRANGERSGTPPDNCRNQ